MIKRYLSRFTHALNGLKFASLNDQGFRSQIYLGVLLLFICLAFLLPLTGTEILFILGAYALILITELQNSALEIALDKIHPEHNDHIKKSKDMAAASVLVAGLFLLTVLISLGLDRLFI
ncbi:diacylglycerol kinase [Candidatus Kaiserbacteria bacterium]|nr:diacylglycerol kinase [Candidatus Kaiserbacteria bacterium]